MGYQGEIYERLMKAVNLARMAPRNDKSFKKLEKLGTASYTKNKKELDFSNENFKEKKATLEL